jgi:hypothetical protein
MVCGGCNATYVVVVVLRQAGLAIRRRCWLESLGQRSRCQPGDAHPQRVGNSRRDELKLPRPEAHHPSSFPPAHCTPSPATQLPCCWLPPHTKAASARPPAQLPACAPCFQDHQDHHDHTPKPISSLILATMAGTIVSEPLNPVDGFNW